MFQVVVFVRQSAYENHRHWGSPFSLSNSLPLPDPPLLLRKASLPKAKTAQPDRRWRALRVELGSAKGRRARYSSYGEAIAATLLIAAYLLSRSLLRITFLKNRIQKSVWIVAPMKTTLDLNDALLSEAKALAAQQRITLTRLIEEGLQLRLRKQKMPSKAVKLPVYKGKGGLAPGLNGLSNKAMLDAADHDT
ncbi:hypothetical protein [Mesorhizobium sp. DCY119]|uniref:hypothetical protein n=1 Tax=Mesorhizobium sp. DCY119 TaxID=2108445 RepID=UPI0018D520D3|nr:hypothetical protein [Mesorhizobium sp. DCY119]